MNTLTTQQQQRNLRKLKRSWYCVNKDIKLKPELITQAFLLFYGVTGNTSDFGSEDSRFEP